MSKWPSWFYKNSVYKPSNSKVNTVEFPFYLCVYVCSYKVNPMPKLSHFTLDHCHVITGECLHHILSADNELTVLRIWSCINITKCQHIELLHRIKDENLDVYLEWFGYDD